MCINHSLPIYLKYKEIYFIVHIKYFAEVIGARYAAFSLILFSVCNLEVIISHFSSTCHHRSIISRYAIMADTIENER